MTQHKTNVLIDKFSSSTNAHHEAISKGDWRTANKHAKQINKVFLEIVKIGEEARNALLTLTDDDNVAIAAMAAVYSLKYDTDKSLATLRCIAKESGLIGFEAEQAIQRWVNGEWHIE
jgi:hypothetical protein